MLITRTGAEGYEFIVQSLELVSVFVGDNYGDEDGSRDIHVNTYSCIGCITHLFASFNCFDIGSYGVSYFHQNFLIPKFLRE